MREGERVREGGARERGRSEQQASNSEQGRIEERIGSSSGPVRDIHVPRANWAAAAVPTSMALSAAQGVGEGEDATGDPRSVSRSVGGSKMPRRYRILKRLTRARWISAGAAFSGPFQPPIKLQLLSMPAPRVTAALPFAIAGAYPCPPALFLSQGCKLFGRRQC